MSDDEPRLVDTGRGFTVRYRHRFLYPTDDPLGSARRRASAARVAPRTLVFVPSLALGYGLAELTAGLPADCHVLCVEADQRLMALARAVPLPQADALTIVRTDSPPRVAALLEELGAWRFRRVAVVSLSAGSLLYPRLYRDMRAALEEQIRLHWQNRLTTMRMSRLWLRNLFTNLALLPASGFLQELRSDRAVVVAGAGPSLERALPWIRRLRARVELLAADTALPVLADAGLHPDGVVTLEAQIQNLEDFLPALPRQAYLLGELTACPQALRLFSRRYLFSSRFHPLQLFDRLAAFGLLPTALPPRGSVGVTAVETALRVTSGPVLLAGLDFAYPGQQSHARGAPAHRGMLHSARRLRPAGMTGFEAILARPRLWLPARGSGRLLSDLVLQQYAQQLRRVIGESGARRVFDIGGLGLDCGARTLGSCDEAEQVCRQAPAPDSPAPPSVASAPAPAPRPEAVRSFCLAETALLEQAEREIEALAGAEAGSLTDTLRKVEYLFLHLPDSDPRRRATAANLRGARAASSYYRAILARAADGGLTPRSS